jgi:DNA-binding transcriptional regulator YiaG
MKDWTPPEIEKFRKAHGLTRRRLGEILGGVTVSTIFKWERGLRKPGKMGKVLLSKIDEEWKMKGGEKNGSKGKRKKSG